MEIKQLISPDKWNGFHQDYLQMKNQFGKFRCRGTYTFISDNDYIKNKFGIFADIKLYTYVLWLENVTRRIRHIRQERALLNSQRQNGFHQVVNNGQKMQSLYLPQIDRSKEDNTDKLFISSQYAKQPKGTTLKLKDGTVITIV